MKEPVSVYRDRRTGAAIVDAIHADRFLDWSYNHRLGRWATELLFSRRWASRLYGWWHRRRWTRRKIRPFATRLGIDLGECVLPPEGFASFAAFIAREIDLDRRPVDPRGDVCVSPVDGRVLAFPRVGRGARFVIKRATFDLCGFLRDDALAGEFEDGAMIVARLYLSDYHHFHFPDGGVPAAARAVPGRYFAVSPYPRRRTVPFFAENRRTITLLESDHFGRVAMVEVGAFTVGSILQDYAPGARVAKGARKGRFELGGSIVVLLFREGAIELDADLVAATRDGMETYVRMGESIGRISVLDRRAGKAAHRTGAAGVAGPSGPPPGSSLPDA